MRKLTNEYVAEYLKEHGCELLSEYKNRRTKVEYRCSCGNISEITIDCFKRGRRCGCGNKNQGIKRRGYTIEQLREIFLQSRCVLLENEYICNKNPMKYICHCGRESKICLSSFLKGRRCLKCGADKNKNPLSEINYKIKRKCRSALDVTLEATGKRKNSKTSILLGYNNKELRDRILNHPNWENVKDGEWQLDHIFPIAAFVRHNILDLKIINALDNLQPLSAIDNMKKKDKYDKVLFKEWLETKGVTLDLS